MLDRLSDRALFMLALLFAAGFAGAIDAILRLVNGG